MAASNTADIRPLRNFRASLLQYLIINLRAPPSKVDNFFSDIFPRWIFQANMRDELDANLVPRKNIIVDSDVQYFCKKFKIPVPTNKLDSSKMPVKEAKAAPLNVHVTTRQTTRLKAIHHGPSAQFDADLMYLLEVYHTLGGIHNNASFPLGLFADRIELFGSPLNTQYAYCSPFPFEQKVWSSLGSFFNYDFATSKQSKYIANPPFDEGLMSLMADKLIAALSAKPTIPLDIVVILPVWDSETQKTLGYDYGMRFEALEKLQKSGFIWEHEVLRKNEYPFFDYYLDTYKSLADAHLILLRNVKSTSSEVETLNDIMQSWKKITSGAVLAESPRAAGKKRSNGKREV